MCALSYPLCWASLRHLSHEEGEYLAWRLFIPLTEAMAKAAMHRHDSLSLALPSTTNHTLIILLESSTALHKSSVLVIPASVK
ncbi:hypothetical protein BDQ12DRAFT_352994 [Crucibulum laeve]|uniref:Uncharacterized protein n=1 Tax=Crucibulum laeve TaxID=68775 RepID=A0A5C3MLQ2_9AGAR|nr:hypothetical protein BDQ12DRAFT_352994 [Crucibulum laeve]